jgi:hypothetical protein
MFEPFRAIIRDLRDKQTLLSIHEFPSVTFDCKSIYNWERG